MGHCVEGSIFEATNMITLHKSLQVGQRGNAALWLMAVNMLLFLLEQFTSAELWTLSAYAKALIQRPWTLMTYMFMHYSVWHLLVNMLWLWMFGRILEMITSPSRVWMIYLLGGVCGGIMYILCDGLTHTQAGMLTGASAAVIAIMTATGLLAPRMEIRLLLPPCQMRLQWIVLAALALVFVGGGAGAFFAHAGGLLGGLGAVMLPRLYMMYLQRAPIISGSSGSYIGSCGESRVGADTPKPTRRARRKMQQAMQRHRQRSQRMDELLQKIQLSGYDSLSAAEREELADISAELRTTQIFISN